MSTTLGTLPDGTRGIDANRRIPAAAALAFVEKGFRFAIRYIRRTEHHDNDLTSEETRTLLGAGLGLMVVQHVSQEGWTPTRSMGEEYGRTAVRESQLASIPRGVTVWLDLEGVAPFVPHADTVAYCNAWFGAVALAGYMPGLYVGDSCGLTPTELYYRLRFQRYWSAYNLNTDEFPLVRGVCMRQRVAPFSSLVPGFSRQNMDVNVIRADEKGGSPTLLLPEHTTS